MSLLFNVSQYYPRRIDYVVVHHSVTVDTAADNWNELWTIHTVGNGWLDIGYNAVVEMVDGVPLAHFGRPDHVIPAHAEGFNDNSLGICIIGNFSLAAPDPLLTMVAARRVVAPWVVQYGVPIENILGHREVPGASTECPGLLFDMDAFRAEVNSYIHQKEAARDPLKA